MPRNSFNTLDTFENGQLYSLPKLESAGLGAISRLPVSIRIVLESVLRNVDGKKISEDDVRSLAKWQAKAERTEEVPFMVARVLLQDFTGVPLLVDLAAMRSTDERFGTDARIVEPLVPVDLVIDHSVQVDFSNRPDALQLNMDIEFKRNQSRYQFLKWGMQAFESFKVVPPGIGIVHQVNLEYLARGVLEKDGVYYPDTLVGTDSHTTMINGLGIVGWGVGGIEAEAGMLGQPVYFLTPDVVGVHLSGSLREGVTATDVVLCLTQMLRKANVVGKFVEYHGEGAATLPVPDRATIANMAPEYGATMGFFPIDEETCTYFKATGRTDEQVETLRNYCKVQGLFGIPRQGQCAYSQVLELNLADVQPSVAGPKRPQDRIELANVKQTFGELLHQPANENGYNKPQDTLGQRFPVPNGGAPLGDLGHGDVLIAAITSCTNTSNPSVMLAAGLVAKKANERGLKVKPWVKTSLAPGSQVVSDYYAASGLQVELDKLGFNLVGYGCTTCIGNSGPLPEPIAEAIDEGDLAVAAVLSGNRNFEGRIHAQVRANYLASPPLVVAYALAGSIRHNLVTEPLGDGSDDKPVYLKDIWPSNREVADTVQHAVQRDAFARRYGNVFEGPPEWRQIKGSGGITYDWEDAST